MSDQQHERLPKLLENHEKAESEVKTIHQQLDDALENGNQRVRVKRLVTSCKDAMTKAIEMQDQLLELILKIDESASLLKYQTWLNVLKTNNNEVWIRARQYIDSVPATDNTWQNASKTTKKTVSSRYGNSVTSTTSSQRQKKLTFPKYGREEFERQLDNAFHLPKQKQ